MVKTEPLDSSFAGMSSEEHRHESDGGDNSPEPLEELQSSANGDTVGTIVATIRSLGPDFAAICHALDESRLSEFRLSSLHQVDEEKRDLWEKEAGGMPLVHPSADVYRGGTCLLEHVAGPQLFRANDAQVFVDGVRQDGPSEEQTKWKLCRQYYRDGRPSTCMSAVFSVEIDESLHISKDSADLDREIDGDVKMFLNTTGCLTDLHIDRGVAAVFIPVEDSERVFFLWPPSEWNLKFLEARMALPEPQALRNCCWAMTGGIALTLNGTEALQIPPGTIHAVITVKGGFLARRTFLDDATLLTMSRWLAHSPSAFAQDSEGGLDRIIPLWLEAAGMAKAEILACSWNMCKQLQELVLAKPDLRKKVQAIFKSASDRLPHNHDLEAVLQALKSAKSRRKRPAPRSDLPDEDATVDPRLRLTKQRRRDEDSAQ